MQIFKNIKERWNRYLKRLAAANARNYGDQRLDCCTLNQTPTPTDSAESTENRTSATLDRNP